MDLYTSCFSNISELPEEAVPISICLKTPDWFQEAEYKALAPKRGFFETYRRNHDKSYYTQCYRAQVLAPLDADEVFHELSLMTGGRTAVLLCYEQMEEFCHRHLVAQWLTENGYSVKEWSRITSPEVPDNSERICFTAIHQEAEEVRFI